MSGFAGLADELASAAPAVQAAVAIAGEACALRIRDVMRADVRASRHFEFANRVTRSRTRKGPMVHEWSIGPLRGGAGSLSHIAYFGGAHGGGKSIRDPQHVADVLAPELEAIMSAALPKFA